MRKNIEAYVRYYRNKEELTEYIQIGAAGIELLRRNVEVVNGSTLLGGFVDACGIPHWTIGKEYAHPVQKTQEVGRIFSRYAIVQHMAAFDLFSRSAVVDFARFSQWARKNIAGLLHDHELVLLTPQDRWGMPSCCNNIANKIGNLSDRLADLHTLCSWEPSAKLAAIIPLFDLGRMVRNRIVHGDSIVGSELAEFSETTDVKKAFSAFRAEYSKGNLPALPKFERGRFLDVTPFHAIFFGAVLYEFAKELNDYICTKISDGEFIDMAFYYGVLAEFHPYRTIKHRSAEGRVGYFLAGRYLMRGSISQGDVITHLKSQKIVARRKSKQVHADLWKIALERHTELSKEEQQMTETNRSAPTSAAVARDKIPAMNERRRSVS